jgi:hypothetical protein
MGASGEMRDVTRMPINVRAHHDQHVEHDDLN